MAVHAPFNFVPLSSWVLYPEWSKRISHDLPLQEGLCGTIGFELTAHTPILVGDEKTDAANNLPGSVSFFKLPDGRYAIPGSSLKGMIKNILSIATFSRMKAVDDQKFSVRYLHNSNLYGENMTEPIYGGFRSRVLAGWLKFEDGNWHLYEAEYARIEQSTIRSIIPLFNFPPRPLPLSRDTPAEIKYGISKRILTFQEVQYTDSGSMPHRHTNKILIYNKVTSLGAGKTGYLVITGQPSPQKHMEFVFSAPGITINVSPSVINDFLSIHSETNEWKYLNTKSPFPPAFGVPVFYIKEHGSVRAMGLAQMFKLAYKHGVHDLISHSYHNVENNKKDFVETLFGCIGETQAESLKGRVSFDYAVCPLNTIKPIRVGPTILNSPKASYYPIYVKQEYDGDPYTTYMDDNAEIQGQKRYPVRDNLNISAIPPIALNNTNIQVNLYPLPATTTFKGKLRFHNLMREELGAVIWALEWGGNEHLRHSLGMGKPFGLGQVSIKVKDESIKIIPNDLNIIPKTIKDYSNIFKTYMENNYNRVNHAPNIPPQQQPQPIVPVVADWRDNLAALRNNLPDAPEPIVEIETHLNWESSEQMKQLLAMADPAEAHDHDLTYMSLGNGNHNNNEFIQEKTQHEHLRPYKP